MRFLPKEKREAMFAFYQFCRVVDDAVDLADSPTDAENQLGKWRQELHRCYQGTPARNITQQLQKVIQQHQIPSDEITAILRGVEMDLTCRQFNAFEELEEYCYCVASAVGLVSSRILGVQKQKGYDFAVLLGKALQLTNILRDLKEDMQKGRLYLPEEDLILFNYSTDKLRNICFCWQDPGGFQELIGFELVRARLFFEKADDCFASLPIADQKRFFPAKIMEEIYKLILQEIQKNPQIILQKRVSVPKWKKLAIALKYWLRSNV